MLEPQILLYFCRQQSKKTQSSSCHRFGQVREFLWCQLFVFFFDDGFCLKVFSSLCMLLHSTLHDSNDSSTANWATVSVISYCRKAWHATSNVPAWGWNGISTRLEADNAVSVLLIETSWHASVVAALRCQQHGTDKGRVVFTT
jgi:hypothetical protein